MAYLMHERFYIDKDTPIDVKPLTEEQKKKCKIANEKVKKMIEEMEKKEKNKKS